MMLFGEKYGDEVRGCRDRRVLARALRGTHVRSTAEVGPFVILSEQSVGLGARRIEAVTSGEAWTILEGRSRELDAVRADLERARRESKRPKEPYAGLDVVWQERTPGLRRGGQGARGGALRDLSDRLRQQEDARRSYWPRRMTGRSRS